MGRSVAVPSGEHRTVIYLADLYDPEDEWGWDDFRDNLIGEVSALFPSMSKPYRPEWIDREISVLLENRHARLCVASYCGLFSVTLLANEDSPLAAHWHDQVSDRFRAHFRDTYKSAYLESRGFASNGEQFFRRTDGLTHTSKEGNTLALMGI